jgi:hypothetical protein
VSERHATTAADTTNGYSESDGLKGGWNYIVKHAQEMFAETQTPSRKSSTR